MGSMETDPRGGPGLPGLPPPGGAQTPPVARPQPREVAPGGGQIVTPGPGKREEVLCHCRAHNMDTVVMGVCSAVAVPTYNAM